MRKFFFISKESKDKEKEGRTGVRAGWLFLLPALIGCSFWSWYPIIMGLPVAMQRFRLLDSTFVGLENFRRLLTDTLVHKALLNTSYYAVLSIGLTFLVPIIIAIFLMEMKPQIIRIMMLLWFVPTGGMAGIVLWKWFYSPQIGLLNYILSWFRIPPVYWLADPRTAMIALVLPGLIMFGPGIIYLGSIQSIPGEYFEAAGLEGAGFWQKLWHITLPRMRPIIAMMLLLSILGSFQVFDNVFIMTGGGPGNATLTIVLYLYRYAFAELDYGMGSALAVMLFVFLLILISIQRKYFKEDIDE